ncbi:ssDNA binding protein, Replication protein A (RPA)-like [Saccharolobus shibatae B12]|uniref:SsDNA binding protein, Replication protein A (RPA)-like n=1 Tax=Saccharolobus shibatae (strain ATCC 51178 / DSM 5389 / JCM 8931 / NBRC 15437 / B12) TaxID=523848 RepID=A0A8F5BKQ5_SACSH|nr:ssDNA binding protein, Replication protein A (RPA)-like [Saccharolobus shibatae B12]QXJ30004.1 ssDNA binding protein, Replication protein A (RPA)-like [Saccharolobus shibatae B12]
MNLIKGFIPEEVIVREYTRKKIYNIPDQTDHLHIYRLLEEYRESVVLVRMEEFLELLGDIVAEYYNSRDVERFIRELEDRVDSHIDKNVRLNIVVLREVKDKEYTERIVRYNIPEGYVPFIEIYEKGLTEEICRSGKKKTEFESTMFRLPVQLYEGLVTKFDEIFSLVSKMLEQEENEKAFNEVILGSNKDNKKREAMMKCLKIIEELEKAKGCAKLNDIIKRAMEEKLQELEVRKLLRDMEKYGIIYESKPDCYRRV